MTGMTPGGTFPCPGCGADLPIGQALCPECGIRLVGDDAARLWTVNQQIATLQAEADRLLAGMRQPKAGVASGAVTTPPPVQPPPEEPVPAPAEAVPARAGTPAPPPVTPPSMTAGLPPLDPAAPPGQAARARSGPSGQVILLALGGLLLLAGASVFVIVVWLLVGVYGQAVLMAAATVGAAVIASVLGKKRLNAAAETLAVVACGLLLLDIHGAHHLGFAGLGDVPVWWYAAGAAVFGSVLAGIADRMTRPRRFIYLPFAATLASLAPWSAVAAVDPHGIALVVALAVVFVLDLGVLVLVVTSAGRYDSPAVLISGVLTLVALVAFGCTDLAIGFDTGRSRLVHLEAALLWLVVPALVAFAFLGPTRDRLAPARSSVAYVLAGCIGISIAMVVFDAPIGVVIAVAAVLAVVVVARAVWSVHAPVRAIADVAAVGQGVLALWVAGDHVGTWPSASAVVLAIPAMLWLVTALVRAVTDREVVWVVVAEVALALAAVRSLSDSSARTAAVVAACVLVANAVVAVVVGRKPRRAPATGGMTYAYSIEVVTLPFLACWAAATIVLAGVVDQSAWLVAAFWLVAVVAVALASGPERFLFAYAGGLSLAAGTTVLLHAHGVGIVEALSLPFSVVLAAMIVAGARWPKRESVRVIALVAVGVQGALALWAASDNLGTSPDGSAVVHAIPAMLWLLAALVRAVTDREIGWVIVAEVALVLAVTRSLTDSSARTSAVVAACVLVVNAVVAGVAARKPRRAAATGRVSFPYAVEMVALAATAGWAGATIVLANAVDRPIWSAVAFWLVGAVAFALASAPGRLPIAYVGAVSVAVGIAVLLHSHHVATVEAYSLPFAALLAAIGFVQVRRTPGLPTMLTAGPALAVAMAPSLVVAISTGEALRLLGITVVGIVVLVVGLLRHWQAPVTAGIVVLVAVAITQGGPFVAYVPAWLILTAAGALLLVLGVSWEAAVNAGRRAGVWYGALR